MLDGTSRVDVEFLWEADKCVSPKKIDDDLSFSSSQSIGALPRLDCELFLDVPDWRGNGLALMTTTLTRNANESRFESGIPSLYSSVPSPLALCMPLMLQCWGDFLLKRTRKNERDRNTSWSVTDFHCEHQTVEDDCEHGYEPTLLSITALKLILSSDRTTRDLFDDFYLFHCFAKRFTEILLKRLDATDLVATSLAVMICLFQRLCHEGYPTERPKDDGPCHDTEPSGAGGLASSRGGHVLLGAMGALR